jgi:predicted PurR-regulated permease PerM
MASGASHDRPSQILRSRPEGTAYNARTMAQETQRDPIRLLIAIAILGGLAAVSVWIMRPFLPALIWATMIVVATWPMMRGLEARLGRKRWAATSLMATALLLAFVLPLTYAVVSLVTNMDVITGWVKHLHERTLESPPDWVARIPLVGTRIDETWRENAATGEFGTKLASSARETGAWFVAKIGDLGAVVVQLLLTVVIAAILYAKGEAAARGVTLFAQAIGGERGEESVVLAGKAIRGVALGVGVTAVVQAIAGAIGIGVAGVPYVGVLTAVMFILALAQIGAVPVMVCATIWVFAQGDTGWGIFLVVWTILVGGLDNVLRPLLIKRGVDLPLMLILIGVIGGLVAFGMVGIFIGPTVLAVTYELLVSWTVASTRSIVPVEDRSHEY